MSSETKKLGAGTTFLLGLVAFGFTTYFARTSSASLGTWIVGLTGLAVVVALVGKFFPQAPTFIRELSARLMRRPSVFFFWCVVVGGGGWTGRTIHDGHVQACTDGLARFSSPKVERFDSNQAALRRLDSVTAGIKTARDACSSVGMTTQIAQLDALQQALSADKPDIAAKAQAEAQREREANAVATFPGKVPEIKASLTEAGKEASQQAWMAADGTLTSIQVALNDFKGTSVEKNADWVSLQKQANAVRTRIKPQVDIIRNRGPMPEFIGGCCFECEWYVKQVAKDPDSIECVRSTVPVIEGPSWTTTMVFRGKNSFGAKVLNQKKFYLQNNKVVDMR